jgi:hypothetical protein
MKRSLLLFTALVFWSCLFAQQQKEFIMSAELGFVKGVGDARHNYGIAAFNYDYIISDFSTIGVGGGIGLTDGTYDRLIFPLYARLKFYFLKAKVSPYFLMNIGYTFSSGHKPGEAFGVSFGTYIGADFPLFGKNNFFAVLGSSYQGHELFKNLNINSKFINKFLWGPDIRIGYRF